MKTCKWCNTTRDLNEFHKHSQMKDGHLNKCKFCVVETVSKWRLANPDCRKKEHERNRDKKGIMVRSEWVKKQKENAAGRKAVAKKYAHKRRAQTNVNMSELDEFVFNEACVVAEEREKTTGIKWEIDHIVPLNHKKACGLHCAANFQVVPASWNRKKNNTTMDVFI